MENNRSAAVKIRFFMYLIQFKPTLWIHKVGVHKTVDILYQFDRCEGSASEIFSGIRGSRCRPVHIYGITETQGPAIFLSHFK
jgi:hypothetical protein